MLIGNHREERMAQLSYAKLKLACDLCRSLAAARRGSEKESCIIATHTLNSFIFRKKIYIYIPPLIVMWIGTRSTNVLRHLWFGLGFFLLSFGQTWVCQLSLSDCSFKSSLDNLKIITDKPDRLPAIFNHPSPANYLLKRASTGIWTETITTHSNLFNFNKMTSAIYIYIYIYIA